MTLDRDLTDLAMNALDAHGYHQLAAGLVANLHAATRLAQLLNPQQAATYAAIAHTTTHTGDPHMRALLYDVSDQLLHKTIADGIVTHVLTTTPIPDNPADLEDPQNTPEGPVEPS